MIVSCPRCQAKYELADDAVRGKVLRGACKNCGCALSLNDSSPFSSSAPLSSQRSSPAASFGTFAPAASVLLPSSANEEDDETRMIPRFSADVSVHEEQTKIGSIPLEALNAEKLFAQRTEPPPGEAAATKPKSLNELVDDIVSGTEPPSESTLPKLAVAEEVTADLASVAESTAATNAVEYAVASDAAIGATAPITSPSRSEPPEVPSDSAIESLPPAAADETTEPLETSDALDNSSDADDQVDAHSLAALGQQALSQDAARQRTRSGWLVVGVVALLVCVLVVWFSGWGARY